MNYLLTVVWYCILSPSVTNKWENFWYYRYMDTPFCHVSIVLKLMWGLPTLKNRKIIYKDKIEV